MTTVIRAELSKNNKYWISKHRYYELKHFCLQYPEWQKEYSTTKRELTKNHCLELITLIEETAREADQYLYDYIIKGVAEGRSYTYLKTVLGIPCGKDMYYDRYRKFFWLLNESRERGVRYGSKRTVG